MAGLRTQQQQGSIFKFALSVRDVATFLFISVAQVRLEIRRGNLKHGNVGRRIVITNGQLQDYLQAHVFGRTK